MRTDVPDDLLDRVRKLLAKAEDEGVTPAEAEALTAKAAELMARYGIDRARLGALHPETDRPADRVFDLDNPWAAVKAHLLAGLAMALRCQCILLRRPEPGSRVHVFGYMSDLERADILFTSLLVQMARALALQPVPAGGSKAKAWRRSWMLGYCTAVTGRVKEAEDAADTDWPQIALLYGELARMAPGPVVELNRAVAVAMAEGPAAGLALVDAIASGGELAHYHLLPATRADLLRRLGRPREAAAAYRQAIALAPTTPERTYLTTRLSSLPPE